jgi:hypothetical protein
MAKNVKKIIKKQKDISYTNKDFKSLRNDLERFALTHFSDNIIDFSDSSLGGMFLDVAAYVGDVMTYYLDHQFNENSIENAVETENIERLVREAGIDIPSAAPAFTTIRLSVIVNATTTSNGYIPNPLEIPVVNKNSVFTSVNGVEFTLLEDVDFNKRDDNGNFVITPQIGRVSGGVPQTFILTAEGVVNSAKIETETFELDDVFVPFRTIILAKDNINEIISVLDSSGDQYYEVDSLTQDTIFKYYENSRSDRSAVPFRMELKHAPKRFIKTRSINTGLTTIRFGSGNEDSFDEDIIPDPSDHAISLFGDKDNLTTVSIDPNSFLETQTLGISPKNTTLTITYRHGGGIGDNVPAGSITSVKSLITTFPTSTPISSEISVKRSLTVFNPRRANGGENEPSIEELRTIAILNRNSQNRIVTREDLVARIYSMPTKFGRVYRTAVSDNPRNPQAAQVFVLSRNASNNLIIAADTLKQNLRTYLSKFRLVSDAIDILDGIIVNFGFEYTVTILNGFNSEVVVNVINSKLIDYFKIENFQINKPILIGDIENLILNTEGVGSLISKNFVSKSGNILGSSYSNYSFKNNDLIDRGYLFPPPGGMFELKYPGQDIVGRVI